MLQMLDGTTKTFYHRQQIGTNFARKKDVGSDYRIRVAVKFRDILNQKELCK